MEMVAAQVKFHTPRNRTIKALRNQNKFLSTFACVWHCYCRLDVQASYVAVLCGVFARFAARTFNAFSRFVGCGGAYISGTPKAQSHADA